MQKLSRIFGIIFVSILIFTVASGVYAQQYSPASVAVDQDVVDGQVVIARAVINGPGWIVIHADANGAPGPVIGYAALMSGTNADVAVVVDTTRVTNVLYAMLHVDAGAVGTYEFPGADAPLMVNDAPIMLAFKITGTSMTVLTTLTISDGFKTFEAAIKRANLMQELKGPGPFTVFAPTDAAFASLPKAKLDELMADPAALKQVLLYHVLPGKIVADDLKDGMETATVQGATVKFSLRDGNIMINDATIKAKNIAAHNGVIHVIDKVLTLPESAQVTGQDAVTASAAVTETTSATTTAVMTDMATMSNTATIRATQAMTPTEMMTSTAMMTPTEMATATEVMTPTAMMTPTEAATSTEMATATEAMTPTAMMTATLTADAGQTGVTPASTATPELTATLMAQAAPAVATPATMPTTGGSFSSATLPAVLLVMMVLAVAAFVTRQRPT